MRQVEFFGAQRTGLRPESLVQATPKRPGRSVAWLAFVFAWLPVATTAQTFTGFDLPIPVVSGGVAEWGDYDGDGDYDFLITGQPETGQAELRVYRNDGGGVLTHQGLTVKLSQTTAAVWGDWDNDNDLDLVVGGADTGGFPVQGVYALTRLYRNDGTNGFTLAGEGIPFVGTPMLVDLDNDGDLDLIVAGQNSIQIHSNEGNGNFKFHAELALPSNTFAVHAADLNADGYADLVHLQLIDGGVVYNARLNSGNFQFGSISSVVAPLGPGLPLYGDLDNDGDEDLGVFSYDNGPSPNYPGWLRNDGSTNTLIPGIVFPLFNLVCSLADYDNDGRLDVAATGGSTTSGNIFRLFHNNANFAFSEVDAGIEGTQFAVMAWGDSDQDGDLDLLLSGIPNPPSAGSPFIRLYRNDTSATNSPPQAPASLSNSVAGSGVVLAWAGATDPNQNGGLTYNVRVGRQPAGVDIVTPAANLATGKLLLPQPGNAGLRNSTPLTNLLAGVYHWSVQAADSVFAASAFAPEQTFTIAPGLPRSGEATASDVRYQHATLTASGIPNGAPALAWFEYGVSTNYDQVTAATAIGSGTLPMFFTNEITGLLTATQYHFRVVISNSVGSAVGSDVVFLIANTLPSISGLTNLVSFLPNQSSPLINFTVGDLESSADSLVVTGTVQNATLIPASGIEFGGSGSNRTLRLTSATEQRGVTTFTVKVTDEHGGQKSQSLTVRVQDFSLFASVASGSGEVVVGDINRDGFLDIVRTDRWFQNLNGTNFAVPSGGTIQNPITGPLAIADIDNDGDLDVSETGSVGTTRRTSIWTNAPASGGSPWLRPSGVTNLQGFFVVVVNPAMSWADFDQDGDCDLLLAGFTNTPTTTNFKTRAYRNDGAYVLSLVPGLFPDLAYAAFGWADFDRDGDLDVCLTGVGNVQTNGYFTGLFSNDGTGHFTNVAAGLLPMAYGFVVCGDIDNDGWPDLFMGGRAAGIPTSTNVARIFRNNGNGTFSEYAAFNGLISQRGCLADLDNDGRLDVLFVGNENASFPTYTARIYLNRGGGQFLDVSPTLPMGASPMTVAVGDLDHDGREDVVLGEQVYRNSFPGTNTPPGAPAGLNAIPLADKVVFSWSQATDANQSGGLTYNLRVGTAPGLANVMSPLADSVSGRRWVSSPGNVSESLQWRLRNLPPGTYYWSVQTIDHAGGESPFAPEHSFVIADPRPRILSLGLTGNTVSLEVEFGWAGNYSILVSPDLNTWNPLPPADYPAGRTNLFLPKSNESSQFLRLRKN